MTVARAAPKQTQRERLIEAIVELSGQHGYPTLSIAQISARAGVSSATFYELFADREECLLAAYRAAAERTMAQMESSLQEGEWDSAAGAAFAELLASLQSDPDAGRLMFLEAVSGGPRLRAELQVVLELLEQSSERLLDSAPPGGSTLDIPGRALIGGVRHIVARHLRTRNEDRLPSLSEEMLAWMGGYAVSASARRWSRDALLDPEPAAALCAEATPEHPDTEPAVRLPRGRHGLAPGVVARSQRSRIVHATASTTMEKGYANVTVADIVAAAGVAKEAFYRHFKDKEEAFLEAQHQPSRYVVESVFASYCSAGEWSERIWRGLRTLLGLVVENPVISHLRLVECYTAGPAAIRQAEEMVRSFAIFLEEGYAQRPQAERLPRLCSEMIAGAIWAMIQHDVAAGDFQRLPARLPQLAYVAIAPFLGPAETIEALEAKVARDLAL